MSLTLLVYQNGEPVQLLKTALSLAAFQALLAPPPAEPLPDVPAVDSAPAVNPQPVSDALTQLNQIGERLIEGVPRPLYALAYLAKTWVCEISSISPKQIVIRGVDFLVRPDVRLLPGVDSRAFSGGNTAWDGMTQPLEFPLSVPGYQAGIYTDKGQYFEFLSTTDNGPQPDPGPGYSLH